MKERKVLICDPDHRWQQTSFNIVNNLCSDVNIASTGKEAQQQLIEQKFDIIILDLETTNFSSIEVIKFIKSRNIPSHILLTAASSEIIKKYFYSEDEIEKLGCSSLLIKPFKAKEIARHIEKLDQHTHWKDISKHKEVSKLKEVKDLDDSFTLIKVNDFFAGNMAIFDLYIRLNKNHYLRFLSQGDPISKTYIKEILKQYPSDNFYFKTKDRKQYVNYLNNVMEKVNRNNKVPLEKKISLIKSMSEKYIEETYTQGITKEFVQEGMSICDNMYNTIQSNKDLKSFFKEYTDFDDSVNTHLFLVGFFSSIISKEIPWITKRSFPFLIMGAFLHDIGKIKMPKNIREMKSFQMSEEQLETYKKHPQLGAELLNQIGNIPEQVIQIVYQHHERSRCNGFPLGLTGVKIFPLAKIVSFSDFLANKVIQYQKNPFETMKIIMNDQTDIYDYDATVVRALLRSFISNDKS